MLKVNKSDKVEKGGRWRWKDEMDEKRWKELNKRGKMKSCSEEWNDD